MLPFIRNWFPRDAYGRVWGFLNSGVQTGYLVASALYAVPLRTSTLQWEKPFLLVSGLAGMRGLRQCRAL